MYSPWLLQEGPALPGSDKQEPLGHGRGHQRGNGARERGGGELWATGWRDRKEQAPERAPLPWQPATPSGRHGHETAMRGCVRSCACALCVRSRALPAMGGGGDAHARGRPRPHDKMAAAAGAGLFVCLYIYMCVCPVRHGAALKCFVAAFFFFLSSSFCYSPFFRGSYVCVCLTSGCPSVATPLLNK